MQFRVRKWLGGQLQYAQIAGVLALLMTGFGLVVYLEALDSWDHIKEWLVWPLVAIALLATLFYGSLVMGGYALLRRLISVDELPTSEKLLFSMTVGLGVFAVCMYLTGSIGGFSPWFAVLFPIGMVGLGLHDLPRFVSVTRERLSQRTNTRLSSFLFATLAFGWGAVMLALLYLTCLTPESFNFDAIWYHVPVAQDYAREGRIVPFYGDNHRAYPQLASLIHTWALLIPGIKVLQLRWMLMLQLELYSVIWRIVGAAAVARWCLNGRRVPSLWVAFFLFPSVYIYDQNIAGSADHVLGMTAAPLFLAVARMMPALDPRYAILGGIAAGCHILTKYQAIYLVAATAVVVVARFFWLLFDQWWSARKLENKPPLLGFRLLKGPIALAGVALLVSSPHFIKNIIFYDNPLYPFGSRFFPSSFEEWNDPDEGMKAVGKLGRPSDLGLHQKDPLGGVLGHAAFGAVGHAAFGAVGLAAPGTPALAGPALAGPALMAEKSSDRPRAAKRARAQLNGTEAEPYDFEFSRRSYSFDPQGDSLVERLVWVHQVFWDWSFKTGNRQLTRGRPYMGSLFTLLLPLLLILRRKKRLLFAAFYSYLAYVTWALTNANDRYLLAFLSIPIGVTAALIVRVWSIGWLARIGLFLLVGLQVVRSTETPFIYAEGRLKDTIVLFKKGQSHAPLESKLYFHGSGIRLTKAFPEDAVVLARYFKANLGFDRTTLNTHRAIQNYINFKRLENPRDLWQICKERGVSHLMYPQGKRQPITAQNIVLFDALVAISANQKKAEGNVIASLRPQAPPNQKPFLVLVKGMRQYQNGLYPVSSLSYDLRKKQRSFIKPIAQLLSKNVEDLLDRADAVLISRARSSDTRVLSSQFEKVERFGSLGVWLRKSPRHGP